MAARKTTPLQAVIRLMIFFIMLSATLCLGQKVNSEEKKLKADVVIEVSKAEMPDDKIYYGFFAEKITNPRCINLGELLASTPEYQEIKRKKIESGTGKYWILLSRANDRTQKQIKDYTADAELAFLCDRETLFRALRKTKDYATVKDKELMKEFDVTDKIIAFNAKSKTIESGEEFVKESLGTLKD